MVGRGVLERHAECARPDEQPALRPLGGERLTGHRVGPADQILVLVFLGGALHQDDHRLRRGPLEVLEEGRPGLGLPLPALDVAQHDDPAIRHHGKSGAEHEDRLRVELSGRALIEVEVAQRGIERPVEDPLDRLVLEDLLGAVEIVDGRQLPLGQGAQQRVQHMGGHAEL